MNTQILDVTIQQADQAMIVRAVGEVDMSSVRTLEVRLHTACRTVPVSSVVIADLTQVTFFGSTGLAVLAAAHELCRERGVSLKVVATTPAVMRTLEVTGLDQLLDLNDSSATKLLDSA